MTRFRMTRRRWLAAAGALAVVLAAFVAWLLLARRAPPPDPTTQAAREQLALLDRRATVAEAAITLSTVRAELESDTSADGLEARVDRVADRLEEALAGPDTADGPTWDALAEGFASLETQLRNDDPDAARTASALADVLSRRDP